MTQSVKWEGTTYLRVRRDIARTPGFCKICKEILDKGAPMEILRCGPESHQWERVHIACVEQLTMSQAFDGAEPVEPVVLEETVPAVVPGLFYGGEPVERVRRYMVTWQGHEVWSSRNRTKAEGAQEMINELGPQGLLTALEA